MRDSDPTLHHCRQVLALVQELHTQGYQRLRIVPGMSPSGAYWRCGITLTSNVLRSHGAMAADAAALSADYTSGMGGEYFDWPDATSDTARDLAAKFIRRFPDLAEAGRGRDWAYAGWYAEMLGYAERGELPVAYADWLEEAPDPRWLPTTRAVRSGLSMPPPGDAEDPDTPEMIFHIERLIRQFFTQLADGEEEFPNEASLQHELAFYLRRVMPDGWRVHIERPAFLYCPAATGLTKKEIDLGIVDTSDGSTVAVELKCPRQGQHPEQMFKACQDLQFLEELVAAGFRGGVFVMHVRDPLFYERGSHAGIYAHFRGGSPICGTIRKPTGARDLMAKVRGPYTPTWAAGHGAGRYWVQAVAPAT